MNRTWNTCGSVISQSGSSSSLDQLPQQALGELTA